MIVLVEVYLRLENRLMAANVEHHEHHPLISSDDSIANRLEVNLTKVGKYSKLCCIQNLLALLHGREIFVL